MRNDSMAEVDSTRQIMSRSEAELLGLKRYFTGVQCIHGHIAERFCKTTKCCECNRIRCAETHQKMILAVPGRADELARKREVAEQRARQAAAVHQRADTIRKARQSALSSGALTYVGRACPKGHNGVRYTKYGTCVACAAEISASAEKKRYDAEYLKKNAERIRARMREYHAANPEYNKLKAKEWVAKNPEKRRSISQNYKHRRRAQEAAGMTYSELHAWKKDARKVCYWCGKKCEKGYVVDHYEPLSKGGKHDASNLVIACRKCNARKSAKDPEQFRAETWHGTLFSHLITPCPTPSLPPSESRTSVSPSIST
jgi:5-methylcytosine-specific restriction endonuclease McrA